MGVEAERQVRHGAGNMHISSRGSNTSRSSKDENYLLSHTTSVPAFEQLRDKKKHKKRERKRKNDSKLPIINGIHRYHKNIQSSTNDFNALPIISKKVPLKIPRSNNLYQIQLRQKKSKKKKKSYQTKYRY